MAERGSYPKEEGRLGKQEPYPCSTARPRWAAGVWLTWVLVSASGCRVAATNPLGEELNAQQRHQRASPQQTPPKRILRDERPADAARPTSPAQTGHKDNPESPDATDTHPASTTPWPENYDAGVAPASARTRTVILVSVDGLAPRYLEAELAQGTVPGFARLGREGAFTHRAFCEAQSSYTMPNHTSMMTGRPALLESNKKAQHGYLINYDAGGDTTLHNHLETEWRYIHSIFDEVHDRGGFTALFAGKSKFELFRRSYSGEHSRPDRYGADNGRNKITAFEIATDSTALMARFLASVESGVASNPQGQNFAMFHLHDTDSAGHSEGWGNSAYLAAIRRADALLQDLMNTVSKSETLADAVVLVSADHGGAAYSHESPVDPDVFRIPVYVWGRGIPTGDLYRVSIGRTDPGQAIAMNTDASESLRNADLGNLALWLLGLPPIVASTRLGFTLRSE